MGKEDKIMNIKSDAINELAKALAKAQKEIEGAHKDSTNPFFKSSYADLASVWDACREPLAKHDLAVVQTTHMDGDKTILDTTLMHSSGQFITGSYLLTPKVNDPQGMGSAMTYARRYCLAAIVGVFQVDDDANLASGKVTEPYIAHKDEKKKIAETLNKNIAQARKAQGDPAHEHAWRNSQYPDQLTGEDMEYCTICKIKRPRQKAEEPELPF